MGELGCGVGLVLGEGLLELLFLLAEGFDLGLEVFLQLFELTPFLRPFPSEPNPLIPQNFQLRLILRPLNLQIKLILLNQLLNFHLVFLSFPRIFPYPLIGLHLGFGEAVLDAGETGSEIAVFGFEFADFCEMRLGLFEGVGCAGEFLAFFEMG